MREQRRSAVPKPLFEEERASFIDRRKLKHRPQAFRLPRKAVQEPDRHEQPSHGLNRWKYGGVFGPHAFDFQGALQTEVFPRLRERHPRREVASDPRLGQRQLVGARKRRHRRCIARDFAGRHRRTGPHAKACRCPPEDLRGATISPVQQALRRKPDPPQGTPSIKVEHLDLCFGKAEPAREPAQKPGGRVRECFRGRDAVAKRVLK